MEYIICELGVCCIILLPLLLALVIGGFLFELAFDRFPGFCHFLERVFDVDLSGEDGEEEWDDE